MTTTSFLTVQELEPQVYRISNDSREIYLIGTAHVSRASVELVERKIREVQPKTVAIELDDKRYHSLKSQNKFRDQDLFTVIREGKSYVLFTQLLLAGFQRKIADELGVKPGEEMLTAGRVADELGLKTECIDREVKITLKRAWSSASLWTMTKLITGLFASLFDSTKVESHDIERLKNSDALEAVMGEFAELIPSVKVTLIDERDRYMAAKLARLSESPIVAVVGAGHVPGILKVINEKISLEELETLPPPRWTSKVLGWSIPAAVVGLIIAGFFYGGKDQSASMIGSWILSTGIPAAIGAAVARAHPLTIIATFFAAPITTIHPLIAAGWVSGLTEVFLRKPRVSDVEELTKDATTVRGWWKNGVTRILLVVMFANLGSALGALLGVGILARQL